MRTILLSLTILACWAAETKLPTDVQATIDKADSAKAKIEQALVKDLTKLQDAYTKKGSLEVAVAIKARIDALNKNVADLLGEKPKADKAPDLIGTWQVLRFDGSSKCSIQVTADGVTQVPFGIKGKLQKNNAIVWTDNSTWQLTDDKGTWTVQASDGAFKLQKQP